MKAIKKSKCNKVHGIDGVLNEYIKCMFSLLNKSNELGLPVDVQLELFDKTVLPVMLYGCEI